MLRTLKLVVMLCFSSTRELFILQVDSSSLFLCWHPAQALITSSLRSASSQSLHPLPIARMSTGICHFSSQKPFITHYNRDGKCETPASVPQCNTSGVISYYSWPSIQVNKDMASSSTQHRPPLHYPSFPWNLRWYFFATSVLRKGDTFFLDFKASINWSHLIWQKSVPPCS